MLTIVFVIFKKDIAPTVVQPTIDVSNSNQPPSSGSLATGLVQQLFSNIYDSAIRLFLSQHL